MVNSVAGALILAAAPDRPLEFTYLDRVPEQDTEAAKAASAKLVTDAIVQTGWYASE